MRHGVIFVLGAFAATLQLGFAADLTDAQIQAAIDLGLKHSYAGFVSGKTIKFDKTADKAVNVIFPGGPSTAPWIEVFSDSDRIATTVAYLANEAYVSVKAPKAEKEILRQKFAFSVNDARRIVNPLGFVTVVLQEGINKKERFIPAGPNIAAGFLAIEADGKSIEALPATTTAWHLTDYVKFNCILVGDCVTSVFVFKPVEGVQELRAVLVDRNGKRWVKTIKTASLFEEH
jgi:hypothetical protein